MFDHLVRDGTILFLSGITILTKVTPAIRAKSYSQTSVHTSVWIGWLLTVAGFVAMVWGVAVESW